MYALTWCHDEDQSHDGVHLVAVGSTAELELVAQTIEDRRASGAGRPQEDLLWVQGLYLTAEVPWGRFIVKQVPTPAQFNPQDWA